MAALILHRALKYRRARQLSFEEPLLAVSLLNFGQTLNDAEFSYKLTLGALTIFLQMPAGQFSDHIVHCYQYLSELTHNPQMKEEFLRQKKETEEGMQETVDPAIKALRLQKKLHVSGVHEELGRAYVSAARVAIQQNRFNRATNQLQKAARIFSQLWTNVRLDNALLALVSALIPFYQEKYEAAIPQFRQACILFEKAGERQHPKVFEALFLLCQAYLRNRNSKEFGEAFDQASTFLFSSQTASDVLLLALRDRFNFQTQMEASMIPRVNFPDQAKTTSAEYVHCIVAGKKKLARKIQLYTYIQGSNSVKVTMNMNFDQKNQSQSIKVQAEQFRHQAKFFSELSHFNIAKFEGWYQPPLDPQSVQRTDLAYLIFDDMDMVLSEAIRQQVPADRKGRLCLELAAVVKYLHKSEVVVFNLSPQNFVLRQNSLKLTDLSCARRKGMGGEAIFAPKREQLKEVFLPPEASKIAATESSLEIPISQARKFDIFTLGWIIWAIAEDKLPTYEEYKLHVQTSRRPEIRKEGLAKELEQLIRECWAELPANRPSAEALSEELQVHFFQLFGLHEQEFETLSLDKKQTVRKLRDPQMGLRSESKTWRLVTYSKVFSGKALVDWLLKHEVCASREDAVEYGNQLLDAGVFAHVTRDHRFKDEVLFYRFAWFDMENEDRSHRLQSAVNSNNANNNSNNTVNANNRNSHNPIYTPEKLSEEQRKVVDRLGDPENGLTLSARTNQLNTYHQVFDGKSFVDWLLKQKICTSRPLAVEYGNQLLDAGVFAHVTRDHRFKDEGLLYRFFWHEELDSPLRSGRASGEESSRVKNTTLNVTSSYSTHFNPEEGNTSNLNSGRSASDRTITRSSHKRNSSTASSLSSSGPTTTREMLSNLPPEFNPIVEKLHHTDSGLRVEDKKWRLHKYHQVFDGKSFVDWLLKQKICTSRPLAVEYGNQLLDAGVFAHVTRDHRFKDEMLFYRFVWDEEAENIRRSAKASSRKLISSTSRTRSNSINYDHLFEGLSAELRPILDCLTHPQEGLTVMTKTYRFQSYHNVFDGKSLTNWLIHHAFAESRSEAVKLGNQLLDAGVFAHVAQEHRFKDEMLFYRFSWHSAKKRSQPQPQGRRRSTSSGSSPSSSAHGSMIAPRSPMDSADTELATLLHSHLGATTPTTTGTGTPSLPHNQVTGTNSLPRNQVIGTNSLPHNQVTGTNSLPRNQVTETNNLPVLGTKTVFERQFRPSVMFSFSTESLKDLLPTSPLGLRWQSALQNIPARQDSFSGRGVTDSFVLGDLFSELKKKPEDLHTLIRDIAHSYPIRLISLIPKIDLKTFEAILPKKTHAINTTDALGRSPLFLAALFGHKDMTALLLREKADITKRDSSGYTPLHIAAAKGNSDVVELLIESGASINVVDSMKRTPLFLSVENNREEVARTLLESHASTDIPNQQGITPLLEAWKNQNSNLGQLLLKHKADINKVDNTDLSPLHVCCDKELIDSAKLLMDQPELKINLRDKNGRCALHIACERGSEQLVQLLTKHKDIDIDLQTINKATPLYFACKQGNLSIVQILVSCKANIREIEKFGYTPLLCSIANGHNEIAKFLIAQKAEINQGSEQGYTPLLLAAHKGNTELVQFLAQGNASVNQTSISGASPISGAAASGFANTVAILISLKANVNVRQDIDGTTPLYLACQGKEPSHFEVTKLLLDAQADINAKTTTGRTPVYAACLQENIPLVQYLMQHGARTDIEDNSGTLPMFYAVDRKNEELVVALLADQTGISKKTKHAGLSAAEYIKKSGTESMRSALRKKKTSLLNLFESKDAPPKPRAATIENRSSFFLSSKKSDPKKKN